MNILIFQQYQQIIVSLILLFFLIALSIIDILTYNKKDGKGIPAILSTSLIIVAFILSPDYNLALISAFFGFLIGMVFVDMDIFRGVADWKVVVGCSIVMPSILYVSIYGFLIAFIGIFVSFLWKKYIGQTDQIPYIPFLTLAYLITMVVIYYV